MKGNYTYLCDGSSDVWALLHVNDNRSDEEPFYMIVNIDKKTALLISDDLVRV